MQWALDNPARYLHERAEFDRLDKEVDWLSLAWRLDSATLTVEVDIDLRVHGKTYAANLTYPDLFPETPAYIRPRVSSEQWSIHQYGPGGTLCLKRRADNWDSRVTGAELVRAAYELLSTEQNPEQPARVPADHRVTPGQAMRSKVHRLVCTPELLLALQSASAQTTMKLQTNTLLHRSATVAFMSRLTQADGSTKDLDLPTGLSSYVPLFAWRGDGIVYKSDAFAKATTIGSVDILLEAVGNAGFPKDDVLVRDPGSTKIPERLVLLVDGDPRSLRAFGIEEGEQSALTEYSVILPEETSQRVPADMVKLAGIRFGIVGLGSIGSKVAVSLARSGARKLLLIDDDFLKPENLCRHELSWAAVGVHKVEGVKEALNLIAPGIDIQARTHRIAGQESALAAAEALKDLTTCDVIIDATAVPEVFVRVAAVAKAARRPLCWGELFGGGFGGLIARARPDIDPNPLAVRTAILQHLQTLPPAPNRDVTRYDAGSEQPLIAGDAEVTQIASALSRLVIDVAIRPSSSEFPYSAYLIGLREEAGWFSQPFDTRPIVVSGEGWRCDIDPEVHERQQKEAVQDLLKILVSGRHADPDTSR
jgi:molybdopterin/thiamine biosynthesis adenylyltransferase/ubiquitin-protein ligase